MQGIVKDSSVASMISRPTRIVPLLANPLLAMVWALQSGVAEPCDWVVTGLFVRRR
jgi:hypothetical protein